MHIKNLSKFIITLKQHDKPKSYLTGRWYWSSTDYQTIKRREVKSHDLSDQKSAFSFVQHKKSWQTLHLPVTFHALVQFHSDWPNHLIWDRLPIITSSGRKENSS